jgi:hypothetical protein
MFFGTLHPVFCKCPSALRGMTLPLLTDGLVGTGAPFLCNSPKPNLTWAD